MSDIDERLKRCFSLALPQVPERLIARASKSSVPEWDSLASVNLVSLIEEEFGIQVPNEDLESFVSFDLIADYLRAKCHAA